MRIVIRTNESKAGLSFINRIKFGIVMFKLKVKDYITQRALTKEFGPTYKDLPLYKELLKIFFTHDPAGINFTDHEDEYSPEVEAIMLKLKRAKSPEDLRSIIHKEFIIWFKHDMAGPESEYEDIAREVWTAWKNYQENKKEFR